MIVARRDLACVFVVVLVPIVLNGPMLFGLVASQPALLVAGFSGPLDWSPTKGYPTIDPNIAFISEAVGRRVAAELAHGRILWWNPFEGAGFPVGESPQAAGMFPLSVLLGLANGVAIERCVLEVFAGLATWLLIRELGCSAVAAMVGAVAYSLNGTASWLGTPWANTAPFLPLLIFGIERLRRTAFGGWALVALALGFSILAGFPEIAYLYGLLALAWAIIRIVQSPQRARFSIGLITSGVAGLLISAPAVIGFVDNLTVAFIGGHVAGAFANATLGAVGIPQVFLPYVWGPIFANHAQDGLWGNVGGYAGVGVCTLALVALFGRSNRPIRFLLFAWVTITLLATFGAPLVHEAVVHFPLVKYTAYFRYFPTSWEFALAMLAAFGIDDLGSYKLDESLKRVGSAVIACCAFVIYSMFAAGINIFSDPNAPFRAWIFYSLEGAIVVLTGIALAATIKRRNIRLALLAAVIVGEVAGYYLVPERGFARSGALDMAPIAFLQRNLRFQRFYTLGPIAPNYGSYFKIASINHNDLPVPNTWIAFIHKHLDPFVDGTVFVGSYPVPKPGMPSRADELRANVRGYEMVGVRYVVSLPDQDPFVGMFESPSSPGPPTPTVLTNMTKVSFHVDGFLASDRLSGVDILQGNYRGSADGVLNVRVCDMRKTCVSGYRAMRPATDNAFFHVDMSHPVRMSPPGFVVTITNRSSKHPEAFWTYPSVAGSGELLSVDGQPLPGKTLRIRFDFASQAHRTFHDQTLSIFELPHPRPYVEAAGCRLTASDRTAIEAICSAPSELHRLELLMPGWHADVNGKRIGITPFDEAFQSVRVPAGRSTVYFWFVPPFVEYGFAALVLSLFAICTSLIIDWRTAAAMLSIKMQGARATSL